MEPRRISRSSWTRNSVPAQAKMTTVRRNWLGSPNDSLFKRRWTHESRRRGRCYCGTRRAQHTSLPHSFLVRHARMDASNQTPLSLTRQPGCASRSYTHDARPTAAQPAPHHPLLPSLISYHIHFNPRGPSHHLQELWMPTARRTATVPSVLRPRIHPRRRFHSD